MSGPGEIGQGIDRLVLAPSARRDAIMQLMRSAQRELALSMFRCDDFTIVDELASAVRRGVKVKVLITQRARGWKEKLKDLTALLRSLGADVRPFEDTVMKYHAKYIIVDDGPALVMSMNFTRKCFENTSDFLLFTDNPEVVSSLKILFENDCTSARAPLPGITDRLIIAPNNARQRLTEMLSGAQTSIRIMDHRVTDPQILAILVEKQRQGVAVQVLGNGPMEGLICHGRMLLIDEKTAMIGSIHLSPPSLDSRREVAIVIQEPSLVAELYDYFQSLARAEANLLTLWATTPMSPEDEDDEEEE